MEIIVGLGNPSAKYEGTRHNVGFETIDRLAAKYGITVNVKKHKALCGRGMIDGVKVVLAKPQTYMNLSGESVRALADFYKVDPSDILIIHDDIDLPVGHIRIRKNGSAGGHNGMKNIILHMGTQEIPRIRIGVGSKPQGWDLADYVLSRYSGQDRTLMDEAQDKAASAAALIAGGDMAKAMNTYNTKKEKKKISGGKKTESSEENRDQE